jgi:hypothetical protein
VRLSLFIPGGFAVVVCIASPALAAHKGKPISAYQNHTEPKKRRRLQLCPDAVVSGVAIL